MKVIPNLLFDFHNDCIDINGNMVLKKIYSMDEYEEYKQSVYTSRNDFEMELAEKVRNRPDKTYHLPGYSETAGHLTDFCIDLNYSDGQTPNFRERVVCPVTELNNRQRFICSYLKKLTDTHHYTSIFTFEQATPVYRFVTHSLKSSSIIGSEYLGIYAAPGDVINGIRHEDATNLTLSDKSFDVVFSSEVLNRTPDLLKTISETSRVLKDGGKFVFSTPFAMNMKATRQRARKTEAGVQHLLDARYYIGHHTREGQSPVFYDLGWDVFEMLKESGFRNAYLLCYYSAFYGYLGESLQSIFVAEK
ncbi:class I SAM-dependent methyltransferase [Puia sp. P3]|uniref:class I SAM-dependent methyltransferase n=1 Tax=Puia sp. P3 TaxID=3423952 RepID=UPI003D6790DF